MYAPQPQDFMLDEAMRVFAENPLFYALPLMDQERFSREVLKQNPEMKKFAEAFDHEFTKIVQTEMIAGLGVPFNVALTGADFYKKVYDKHGVKYEIGKEADKRIKDLKIRYAKAIIGDQNMPGGLLKGNLEGLSQFLQMNREFIDFILENSKTLISGAKQWKENLNAGELPAIEQSWGYTEADKNRKLLEQAQQKENILKPLDGAYAFSSAEEADAYVENVRAELSSLNDEQLNVLLIRKVNYILQKNAVEKFQKANKVLLDRLTAQLENMSSSEQQKKLFMDLALPQLNQIKTDINPRLYHQIANLVVKNASYYFAQFTKTNITGLIDNVLKASGKELSQTQLEIIENSKNDPTLFKQMSNAIKTLSLQRPDFQIEMQRMIERVLFQFFNSKFAEHPAKASEDVQKKRAQEGSLFKEKKQEPIEASSSGKSPPSSKHK